jgi:DNA-binding NtrC family response regulator
MNSLHEKINEKKTERPAGPDAPTNAARSRRIAVVDDEAVITRMLQRFLDRRGHQVQVFGSGTDFLTAYDPATPPDLVILDICMPGLDGFEVIDQLSGPGTQLPPILLISGYDATNRLPEMLGRGRIAFLAKPFALEALSEQIETLQTGP